MSIKIIKKEEQAKGAFAGGAILENKPIGFPQDGGMQKPYSNLFYWANAWSDNGGLIGEHPHKMFEIMSFVIDGEIQHYDSKFDRWLSLYKGDAQIIRSGSGITHAEKLLPGGRMFQIWFDPNIQQTINHEASYNDYKSAEMPYEPIKEGLKRKRYVGAGGPVKMESEGVVVSEFKLEDGNYEINLNQDKIYSYYIIEGEPSFGGNKVKKDDFIIIEGENHIEIKTSSSARLFMVSVPRQLSYKTYLELVNN
ncbi:MAG: pirin family protein [Vicingus serpentipes]|nr:pirin family protein [Vicingus serpentipes]